MSIITVLTLACIMFFMLTIVLAKECKKIRIQYNASIARIKTTLHENELLLLDLKSYVVSHPVGHKKDTVALTRRKISDKVKAIRTIVRDLEEI